MLLIPNHYPSQWAMRIAVTLGMKKTEWDETKTWYKPSTISSIQMNRCRLLNWDPIAIGIITRMHDLS